MIDISLDYFCSSLTCVKTRRGATSQDLYIYIYIYIYVWEQKAKQKRALLRQKTQILKTCQTMSTYVVNIRACSTYSRIFNTNGFPPGSIRQNWKGTEKISMAPAQGWHAQIGKCKHFCSQTKQCHSSDRFSLLPLLRFVADCYLLGLPLRFIYLRQNT